MQRREAVLEHAVDLALELEEADLEHSIPLAQRQHLASEVLPAPLKVDRLHNEELLQSGRLFEGCLGGVAGLGALALVFVVEPRESALHGGQCRADVGAHLQERAPRGRRGRHPCWPGAREQRRGGRRGAYRKRGRGEEKKEGVCMHFLRCGVSPHKMRATATLSAGARPEGQAEPAAHLEVYTARRKTSASLGRTPCWRATRSPCIVGNAHRRTRTQNTNVAHVK